MVSGINNTTYIIREIFTLRVDYLPITIEYIQYIILGSYETTKY